MPKPMGKEDIARFCLSLPGAREDYKWGGVRVFSVAEKKMFAVMDLAGGELAFKVAADLFLATSTGPDTPCALSGQSALDQRDETGGVERTGNQGSGDPLS